MLTEGFWYYSIKINKGVSVSIVLPLRPLVKR